MSLAAQTLSASVVSTTDFLRDELSFPQFQDSDATAEFIRCIDLAFDLMYSRNPFTKGTNQPVILEYFPKWASECESLASYIFHLKDEKYFWHTNSPRVILNCSSVRFKGGVAGVMVTGA